MVGSSGASLMRKENSEKTTSESRGGRSMERERRHRENERALFIR
jgi:hypothetical protein